MMALALVGPIGSKRQIIADHLASKGFDPLPIKDLMEKRGSIGDKIVIPDMATSEQAAFARELGVTIVGVVISDTTRLETLKQRGDMKRETKVSALKDFDSARGHIVQETQILFDAIVSAEVPETTLLQNIERIVAPPVKVEGAEGGSPER